jgi:hypothetical protein
MADSEERTFNPGNIPLQPSNWFTETITYAGWGQAEFESPKGVIEWPATVHFAELSRPAVDMVIDHFECEHTLRLGLTEFLSGATPVQSGDHWGLGIGLDQNTCHSIMIRTDEGILAASGTIHFSPRFHLPGADPKDTPLTFFPLRLEYNAVDAAPAKYWVIPLVNFLSEPHQSHPALNQHPLRIHPTPEVPDGLTESDKLRAQVYANQHNRLIIFECGGTPGFVERVPGYNDRAVALREGRLRHAITAVMVAELASTAPTIADLASWPPLDLVPLLSLASGSGVEAPWVECRDATGRLVRRLHASGTPECFSRGHTAIDENVHTGTGRLLTCAQASPEFRTDNPSVALVHLIRGGRYGQSLEDRLSHLFPGVRVPV